MKKTNWAKQKGLVAKAACNERATALAQVKLLRYKSNQIDYCALKGIFILYSFNVKSIIQGWLSKLEGRGWAGGWQGTLWRGED